MKNGKPISQKNPLDFASGFRSQIKIAIQPTYLVAVGLGFCKYSQTNPVRSAF